MHTALFLFFLGKGMEKSSIFIGIDSSQAAGKKKKKNTVLLWLLQEEGKWEKHRPRTGHTQKTSTNGNTGRDFMDSLGKGLGIGILG